MKIQSERQLRNTKEKLAELESEYNRLAQEPCDDRARRARQLTLRSLGSLMKQLKEEIACYESRRVHPAG